ncbi:MAG: Xaa-Pro aminopeptidase, partial [Lachnospiraceae bacterium]|nr:Xaa-Pro aminopeptidase [Lachnospiraceae bacterium]
WTASPVYPGSKVTLQSGMMFQMDIIPSVPGYGGASAEDGIAIADEALREELKNKYPDTWNRIVERRRFMKEELGINLKAEILPMSDICGYMRPYVLNHGYALKKG